MVAEIDGENVSNSPTRKLIFAYYVTGHGFGHATRAVEVARHLINAGHDVHLVSAAPDFVYTTEIQSPGLHIRNVILDCGAVQADALTVDRVASLEKYHKTAMVPRESILRIEVEWLNSIKADLVISDVVPVACRAAANAGVRCVCVTNFSWDFIYADYIMVAGHHHRSIIWQIAEDYSHAEFLIRLPGYCPMPAFRDVVDVPLVVRRLHKSRKEVRKELGIEDDVKLLILNFGGQPSGLKLNEEHLPPGWKCLVCGVSEKDVLPPRFIKLPRDIYTPDVIAASDCMLGKIGYGAASEALAYNLPFVFVRRDYFNEEPFVRNLLEYHQCGVEMITRDLLTGHWKPYIDRAMSLKPCYAGAINGGEVAARILQEAAVGKYRVSDKFSGARRLRDAIVLGYQLQRIPGRDPGLSVPEWYASAQNELTHRSGTSMLGADGAIVESDSLYKEFEILHGDFLDLHDTKVFLSSLAELGKVTEKDAMHHSREHKAATAFFNWEEEIYVTRAPGRLDVIGGIADYSGSLVLQAFPLSPLANKQLGLIISGYVGHFALALCCFFLRTSKMPIKEACHVALQKNHPRKHKLWKHAHARQHDKGHELMPVLQIVSFGAELSNRGPTFDMDLSDFMDGDKPISYDKARRYFSRDPSQKWAAYVAGTILVLMTELGVQFDNSISMLVSSAVPEGKGVSSSASVEVASMTAVAAAHGLDLSPRELALLCQKVENCIVGAPCGVMDQMASACGEANKLLAMVCQPAEVLGLVDIPTHIHFWGIDSGIRHSVGGADYGSVRIGAFMGREMIKSSASETHTRSQLSNDGINPNDSDRNNYQILGDEANLDYLCNLTPHRYEAAYAYTLPDSIDGETFLERYENHNDPMTVIDPNTSYAVRAAARHPIYENFRVKAFKALLTSAASEDQLTSLGEVIYQCHYSYNACGLGSDGTDRIVELVQELQHSKASEPEDAGLYGAKITGGGSGGTVCVIGRNTMKSSHQIYEIQQKYKAATGYLPFLFEGSSPGAGKFGYLKIRLTSVK